MAASNQVIAGNVVPFTEAQIAEAVQPALSARVVQIVLASGVPSLQALTTTPKAVIEAVKLYWEKR